MEQIKPGKRPRNPLRKRVWKDLLSDQKRHVMIFLMLVVVIGFVSGMYVANNSMMTSLDSNAEKFLREDGNFELSEPVGTADIAAIETGKRADVLEYYRNKAYSEAENKVKDAVNEKVEKTVADKVRSAIIDNVTKTVNEQLSKAESAGAALSNDVKKKTLDDAVEKALKENYDTAYDEALKTALSSDDYKDAYDKALNEAKEKIDKELSEKYDDLAERYDLNSDSRDVPITVYELFYKDKSEYLSKDSAEIGKIRVYNERTEIDLYDLLDGRKPENENEIIIDRMHADNNSIKVGDTFYVGSKEFKVVGLAAFTDYTTLYENNNETMFDALTFDVAMTTPEGFDRISGRLHAKYAFKYNDPPKDVYEEKEMSEDLLKALITQTLTAETEDLEIEDFVPEYLNKAIIFAPDDMGSDKAMGGVLLYILIAVLAFISAVTISTALEKESTVIGTLRASGYTKWELVRYYMTAPLLIIVFAALVGNILGYTVMKKVVVAMYYNSYSLPAYSTVWTPDAFIRTTIVPVILMLAINFIIIIRMLKLSPLRFLRRDLKKKKRKKAVKLPKFKFFSRFRIRVLLQNIPNYIMLFVGVSFVMILLSMAVGMPETLKYYQDNITDMMFVNEQVILTDSQDEDGNPITTKTVDAEKFSVTALNYETASHDEEITVYGLSPNSRYMDIGNENSSGVYISKAYSEKYNIEKGDKITLSEKYENKTYTFDVSGICDYSAAIAVFMNNETFNSEFDRASDDFNGFLTDQGITDIDEKYIAKTITKNDLIKMAKQLDHSMGDYMVYFQYACAVIAAILLYLLTKIIIEKNENSISMVKILGYTDGEIASLYLVSTAVIMVITEVIAIAVGYKVMSLFWNVMLASLGGWYTFVISPEGFLKEFLLVFIAYAVITVIDFFRIRRIPKVLALKNME